MRYIRAKDGIFEIVKEDGNWLEVISNFERKMQCHCVIKKHAVIKQADTIEELCDVFVIINKKGKKELLSNTKNISLFWEDNETVYGAIWTDKGLIYVAKMNQKGELELL